MKYILRHKVHKTYYCFDDKFKFKYFSVYSKNAYRFKTEYTATRMIKKFKHPENWEVRKVREHQIRQFKTSKTILKEKTV